MAERQQRNGRSAGGPSDGPPDQQAIARACQQLAGFVGRPIESVIAVAPDPDSGGWRVCTQVVEVERLPHTTDLLACYELLLDGDGELLSFNRTRRYGRGQIDAGDANE